MTEQHNEKIWDVFIRVFHWSLVAAIGFCWFSAEQGGDWMDWHLRSGYLVLGLIFLRLLWGMVGSHHARFKNFIYSPAQTIRYLGAMLKRQEPQYAGHNPAGAIGVFLLLLFCVIQASTGLFATDDIMFDGPLMSLIDYDLSIAITRFHKLFFNAFLVLIAAHVLAVFYHQIFRKEKLIQSMIHGRK